MGAFYISVIIPTYNRSHYIRRTIDSFLNQTYDPARYEIIIVNNNSTDDTLEVLKPYQEKYKERIIVLNEFRQGVHFARNTAAKSAKGELLYYTDDDMIADPDLLNEIIKPFLLDDKVATTSGRVLPQWETEPPKWVLKHCINGYLSLSDPSYDLLISSRDCNVYSCHQAIKKDVLFQAGGFNPENTQGEWIGDGETGLNLKIKELGYKFAFNGNSLIFHIIPPTRMTQTYLNKRLGNQGNCDSYADYKRYRFTAFELSKKIFNHFVKLLYHVFKTAVFIILISSKWRLNLSQAYYDLARIKYDYKLIRSVRWRELVLKYDWINE